MENFSSLYIYRSTHIFVTAR